MSYCLNKVAITIHFHFPASFKKPGMKLDSANFHKHYIFCEKAKYYY